jgi:hypothetical protein
MRRRIRFVASGLICGVLGLAAVDASAAPRGQGGPAVRGHFGTPAFGVRGIRPRGHFSLNRYGAHRFGRFHGSRIHHGRFHHGRYAWRGHHGRYAWGGWYVAPWPGYVDAVGYSSSPSVIVEPGAPRDPTVLDWPAVPGIRSAPSAAPMIYVINSDADRRRNLRKRVDRLGPKILSRQADGGFAESSDAFDAPAGSTGPRIIQVRVPRRD